MYCKKCGFKLTAGSRVCAECGTDNANVEYCGGFWGLVGKNENEKEGVTAERSLQSISFERELSQKGKSEKRNMYDADLEQKQNRKYKESYEDIVRRRKKEKKESLLIITVMISLIILLMIFLMVLLLSNRRIKDNFSEEMDSKIGVLNSRITVLESNNSTLEDEIRNLKIVLSNLEEFQNNHSMDSSNESLENSYADEMEGEDYSFVNDERNKEPDIRDEYKINGTDVDDTFSGEYSEAVIESERDTKNKNPIQSIENIKNIKGEE